MSDPDHRLVPTPEQQRRRRQRNIALALALGFLVVLFYVVSFVKGPGIATKGF